MGAGGNQPSGAIVKGDAPGHVVGAHQALPLLTSGLLQHVQHVVEIQPHLLHLVILLLGVAEGGGVEQELHVWIQTQLLPDRPSLGRIVPQQDVVPRIAHLQQLALVVEGRAELHVAVIGAGHTQRALFLQHAVETGVLVWVVVAHLLEGAVAVPGLDVDLALGGEFQIEALVEVVHRDPGAGLGLHAVAGGGVQRAHVGRDVELFLRSLAVPEQPHDVRLRAQLVQLLGDVAGVVVVGAEVEGAEHHQVVVDALPAAGAGHDVVAIGAEQGRDEEIEHPVLLEVALDCLKSHVMKRLSVGFSSV